MTMCTENSIINSPISQIDERDTVMKYCVEKLANIFKDKLQAEAQSSSDASYRVPYRRMMKELWPYIISTRTTLPFTWDASDLQTLARRATEIFKKDGLAMTIRYNPHTACFSLKLPRYS